ncbi:MAG: tripartite tricarboxylate transporter permease [Candidatus Puniceispirillaceae bacterium]
MGIGDHILLGFDAVLYGSGAVSVLGLAVPLPLLTVALGLLTGIVIGSIPGLAGPMVMAVALPILISIFGYETSAFLPVLGFLIGIMKGATVGGAVPAILFNTPGTPDALMTTLDGYPMTRRGKAFKALRVAHFSSVSGDTFSDIMLFVCAPFLALVVEAYLDLPEKAALIMLSLCFLAAIVGKPVSKGVIAVGLGLFVATIGTGEDFYPRLTGGVVELSGGFPIACVILGTLVIGEVFAALHAMRGEIATTGRLVSHEVAGDNSLPLAEKRGLLSTILPSAVIGTSIGALPGIGSTLAATLGYSAARRRHEARHPDAEGEARFGSGLPQGVAATEAANSAVSGANLIPVLSLGIPGNAAAVFLILAMDSINGLNPSPGVFKLPSSGTNPEMVMAFGLFTLMAAANILNWIGGLHVMRLMGNMIHIPKQVLLPTVLLLTIVGIYVQDSSLLAVGWLIMFGFAGFIMRLTGLPILPFVIAFILGAPLERTARQAFSATGGDPLFLFSSPICVMLMTGCILVLVHFARKPAL